MTPSDIRAEAQEMDRRLEDPAERDALADARAKLRDWIGTHPGAFWAEHRVDVLRKAQTSSGVECHFSIFRLILKNFGYQPEWRPDGDGGGCWCLALPAGGSHSVPSQRPAVVVRDGLDGQR